MYFCASAKTVVLPFVFYDWGIPSGSVVKNLPANVGDLQETHVQSLGHEDPLKKEMATHSSTLAWRIPWTEEPGGLLSMGSQRVSPSESSSPRRMSLLLTSSHSELCSVLQTDHMITHIHFFPSLPFPCVSPSPTYSAVSIETSLFPRAFQNPRIQVQFSSVQFSYSVMSDSLQPHEPQHARPPCPSPTPGVYPNPCPLSQ